MIVTARNYIKCRIPTITKELSLSASFSHKSNPGTRRRMKLTNDIEESDLEDLDYEANFETISLSHRDHIQEMKKTREKLQYDVVKQKYFKKVYPNFLTWHDKEQIRLLHRRNPDEWDVHKLSEGFPALPDIIQKILKSNWTMDNLSKIKNHDMSVQENWRKLKNGELNDLPENLVKHLNKFSSRAINLQSHEYEPIVDKVQVTTTTKSTEFSDIITSYEKLKNKSRDSKNGQNLELNIASKPVQSSKTLEEETYIEGSVENKQLMTFDEFKQDLNKNISQRSFEDAEILSSVRSETEVNVTKEEPIISESQIDTYKYNTGKIMELNEKKEKDYNHLCYPQVIKIPKKILKRGYTYKLNDCYYDSDGRFLYRTPGMY